MVGWVAAVLLPALSLVAPAVAQQPDVSMKIDVIAWGDEIGGLSFKAGRKNTGITALPFRYSEPVPYTGPAVMEIFRNSSGTAKPQVQASEEDRKNELMPLMPTPPAEAEKGAAGKQGLALELEKRREKEPALVALAALPANCRRATVLLAPAEGGTFLAYVIDDDPSKLPLGQLRVHNLSPHTIAMRLNGAAPKEIKSRDALMVQASNQALGYDLAYQLDGEWKFQEHNIIPVRTDEQTQMIILHSGNAYFRSSDGSTGGYLQVVTLRRGTATP